MKQIFENIKKYSMIEPGMHIIAGVSGGADSVCLLYVLKEFQRQMDFSLSVVHVEHGIRGEESIQDGNFVRELCKRLDVPFEMIHRNIPELAARTGMSLEETARTERYKIFREFCEKYENGRIAVAHNRNDQSETVIHNLVRGSGLRGLGGMRPVRDRIIRPLLFTQRSEIERILTEAGLTWRTDQTNLTEDYTRNRIRHSILPMMQEHLNAQAGKHIADTARQLQQVQDFLDQLTEQAASSCIRKEFSEREQRDSFILQLSPFETYPELVQIGLLQSVLDQCGGLKDVGRTHLEALQQLAGMDCGRELCLPHRVRAVREDGIIRFQTLQQKAEPAQAISSRLEIPGVCRAGKYQIYTEILGNTPELFGEIIKEKKCTKWISYDKIGNDVLLRTRQPGDYLVVNKSGGRKKLKEYFIDQKVPKDQRDQVLLIAEGAQILWVVGGRISESVKVQPDTRKVLRIQILEEKS